MPIAHGSRRVQHHVMSQVGLLFVLFYVMPICLSVNLPIHVSEFVSGIVWSMLSKFDREAVIGTFVKPGYEPLDNQSGPQLHIGNLTYKGRVEVFEGLCICTHGFCTLKKECELRAEGYQWFLQIESSLRGLFQGSSTRSRMQLGWLVCGGAAAHRNARGNPASFAVSYADKIRYHSATCQTEPDTT